MLTYLHMLTYLPCHACSSNNDDHFDMHVHGELGAPVTGRSPPGRPRAVAVLCYRPLRPHGSQGDEVALALWWLFNGCADI